MQNIKIMHHLFNFHFYYYFLTNLIQIYFINPRFFPFIKLNFFWIVSGFLSIRNSLKSFMVETKLSLQKELRMNFSKHQLCSLFLQNLSKVLKNVYFLNFNQILIKLTNNIVLVLLLNQNQIFILHHQKRKILRHYFK